MSISFLLRSPVHVEGIGRSRARRLREAGIATIADLFAAGPRRIHTLVPGASARQVGDWFCAGALLRIAEMTPDLAEAFVAAGLRSVPAIADAGLERLERAVKAAVTSRRLAKAPSLYGLSELQRHAWRARGTGMLAGTVFDEAKQPVAGASVTAAGDSETTDAEGRFAFARVPAGAHRPTIETPEGRAVRTGPIRVRAGLLAGPLRLRVSRTLLPAGRWREDESEGALIVPHRTDRPRMVLVDLAEFRDGAPFLVREFREGDVARLLSLDKVRAGRVALVRRTDVPKTRLPAGTKVGDVLRLQGGSFRLAGVTAEDLSKERLEAWRAARPARRVIRLDLR